jgi:hypothetical protein
MNVTKFKSGFLALLLLVSVAFVGVGNVAAAGDVTVDVTYTNPGGTQTALQGATVELIDSSGNVVNTMETDSNGAAVFSGVSDGDYTAEVTDPYGNNTNTISTFSVAGSAVSQSTNFSTTQTDFEVDVTDAQSTEFVGEGVSVELQNASDGTVVDSTTTTADGVAVFDGGYDASVEYDVVVAPDSSEYDTATTSLTFSDYSEYDTTFTTASVNPIYTVTFDFVNPDGGAADRGLIDHYDSSDTLVDTYYSDSEGTATVDLVYNTEATFEASDEAGNYETASKTVTVDSDKTVTVNFETPSSDAVTSLQVSETTSSDSTDSTSGGGGGGGFGGSGNMPIIVGGVLALLALFGFFAIKE